MRANKRLVVACARVCAVRARRKLYGRKKRHDLLLLALGVAVLGQLDELLLLVLSLACAAGRHCDVCVGLGVWEGVSFTCREERKKGEKERQREKTRERERERYLVAGLGLEVQHTHAHTESGWERPFGASAQGSASVAASHRARPAAAAAAAAAA